MPASGKTTFAMHSTRRPVLASAGKKPLANVLNLDDNRKSA